MKKICMFIGFYPINRGGAEYQSHFIAKYLKNKYDIFFISIGQEKEVIIHEEGFKIYCLKKPYLLGKFLGWFLLNRKITNILDREIPDYIYQRIGFAGTGIAAHYCKRSNCELLFHSSSQKDAKIKFFENLRNPFNVIDKLFYYYGLKNTDFLITQTQQVADEILKKYKRRSDLTLYNFGEMPKEDLNKCYSSLIRVLWIGNVKISKGPNTFFKIAREFEYIKDIHFTMIGRTNSECFAKGNILKNVDVIGEIPQQKVNEYLAESHILLNTSITEGFPNVFVQAWFRKVPVVSLNIDPDDIINSRKLGFCAHGDFDFLIRGLKEFLRNPSLLKIYGENSYNFAKENCTFSNIDKIITLIEE